MLVFRPYEANPHVIEFQNMPTLEELRAAIGSGHLELVPGFCTIDHCGAVMECIALCDGNGKRKELQINNVATTAWDQALQRDGGVGLLQSNGLPFDFLVGPIAVVFGDRGFMAAL
jgi:hypothetical protein